MRIKNFFIFCLLVTVMIFFVPRTSDAQSPQTVFQPGTEGYTCFRIPAILQTSKGTLLAFAEARKNSCKDEGRIDLVLRRSTDKGHSWGPLILVWSDGANTCGNPVPVLDRKTGTILLLMTWNLADDAIRAINAGTSKDTRRVYLTRSTDDGLHWQTPAEITSQVKPSSWGWYATGPCHGIQITKGKYEGRLVVPCDYIEAGRNVHHVSHSHVIWSDDGGAHWKLGGVPDLPNVNESSVAELSDGSLLLSMRSKPYRRMARSTDGGATWSVDPTDSTLFDPACQGAILNGSRKDVYFSNPYAPARANMTIHLSEDDGRHWLRSYQVYKGPSAYSDLVMPDDHHIAILYEAGLSKPYEGIVFATIDINDFK
jgi:sialidase-1